MAIGCIASLGAQVSACTSCSPQSNISNAIYNNMNCSSVQPCERDLIFHRGYDRTNNHCCINVQNTDPNNTYIVIVFANSNVDDLTNGWTLIEIPPGGTDCISLHGIGSGILDIEIILNGSNPGPDRCHCASTFSVSCQ